MSLVVTPAGGGIGSNAYVLGNTMGVDTESGALWQFNVASDGALSASSASAVSIGPTALAQSLQVDSLYVLTANTGVGGNAGSGGSLINYGLGTTDGVPVVVATTSLAVPHPVSMDILFLLAP